MGRGQVFRLGARAGAIGIGFLFLAIMGCRSMGTHNPVTERQDFIFVPAATEVQLGRDV